MAKMLAKFKLESITSTEYGDALSFGVVCPDKFDADGNSEDCTFSKFSPSGKLEIMVTNPALKGGFKPGEKYYVEVTSVMPPAEVQPELPASVEASNA